MRALLILTLVLNFALATDLTIKSDGTAASGNGVSIQNSNSTELMIIEGDGDVSIDGTTVQVDAANNKVGVGTASPIATFHVSGDEGFLVQGTQYGGTVLNLGAGTRMHFYSVHSAFRAGMIDNTSFSGTAWDHSNMGNYSAAMGRNTIARGESSFAMGKSTTASANWSTALGAYTTASGLMSTAMGDVTTASGEDATAMGDHTTAESYAETAIGAYNTDYTPTSATSWNTSDRLFVVGNGTSSGRSDALVILKNGNATLAGTLTQSSDARLKERVRPLDSALEKVAALEGKYFYWNGVKPHDTEAEQVGLMAQEVQAVLPQLVRTDQSEDAYLSVNYQGFVPVLINAINEQQVQIDALKAQNDMLMKQLVGNVPEMDQPGFFKRLFSRLSKNEESPALTAVLP